MSSETPKEAVEASEDRFERLESLVRRASRVEGRVVAVETQLANASSAVDGETGDTVAGLCQGIRSDVEALQGAASSFLDAEADSRALYSMTSVFTSDLSEVAAHLPEGGELGRDLEPFAETFEQVCGFFERELELLQAALVLEAGFGEPSVDSLEEGEVTSEAIVSRIEDLQAQRKSVAAALDEEGGMEGFELTETAFFG